MIKKILLAALMFAGVAAFGQSLTTITGTIRDGSGALITSGQVAFTLQPGDSATSGIARFTPTETDCLINGSGLVKALDGVSACTVVQNTSITTPSSTSYKACIQPSFIQPGSCFVFYAIGSSLDITTTPATPSLTPAYSLVDTFSNQTIAGNKTFTGTITYAGSFPIINQSPNGSDMIASSRATDTSPTGNFLNFKTLAGVTLFKVDVLGNVAVGDGTAAAPSISFANSLNTGFYKFTGIPDPVLSVSGVNNILFANALVRLRSGHTLGFSSNSDPTLATADTTITRSAAGVLRVGTNEATPNALGEMDMANLKVSSLGNFANLEAIMFADQYGNNTTTGIAGAIAAAGVVNKTNIWVPSSYATTESVPGSVAQWKSGGPGSLASMGGNTTANLTFQDNRFGRYFSALDPKGDSALINPNYSAWFNWNVNYIAGPSGLTFNNRTLLGLNMNPMDGGFNFNNNTYSNKEAYASIDSRITSFTPGQKYGIASFNTNYSTGDQLAFFGQNACYGGFTAGGDEGCEAFDFEAYHGNVEYTATIASGASTGATSLTMNTPSAGATTQGSYRFLIDITQVASAGTISAITFTNGTTPVAITGVGTSFGTSTVNTTLGTAVTTPGSVTVTPAAMTNITTATNLCIADPFTFEHVTPTATTGTTFTATFRYAHPTTAIVAFGGACGKYIELVADRVTSAVFGSTSNVNTGGNTGNAGQVVNTLHWIIPMVRSTSNTAADIWLTNPATGYIAYRGRWTSGGTNTYAIYPGAQVTSVQGATASCVNNSTCGTGNIGNTFTLEQNSAAWVNGDTVALPLYFVQNVSLGQMIYQNLFPQAGGGFLGALSIQANGITQSGDTYVGITNNSPAAIYTAGGGVLSPPWAFQLSGSFQNIFRINTNPTVLIRSNDNTSQGTIYQQGNNPLTDNDQWAFSPTTDEFWAGGSGNGLKIALNAQNGSIRQKETTAPSGSAGFTVCYSDSTAHAQECSFNNGTFFQTAQVIKATSTAFATATTAGTCVQSTTAVTGATTAMTAQASPVSTPGVGAQWSAFVSSAGNVTINECAVAASAGGTIAFNIRVTP